jgi:hypothetical protein
MLKPILIKYHNNVEYSALLHGTDDEWYLHYGYFAAQKFGFQVPTTVYLDFQIHDNRFNMSLSKPNYTVNPGAENIIVLLSSDSDENDDDGNNDEESNDDEDEGSDDDGNTDQTGGESDDGVSIDDEDEDDDLFEFDVTVSEALAYTNQVMVCFKPAHFYLKFKPIFFLCHTFKSLFSIICFCYSISRTEHRNMCWGRSNHSFICGI